jgi:hypothetical protein
MAFVVSPATGSTVQEEHERVGAAGAVSARNEEAIGGAVQGAAQKTLFERLRGFTVGQGGDEHPNDEENQRSRNGAPDDSHPLVSHGSASFTRAVYLCSVKVNVPTGGVVPFMTK